VCGQKAGRSHQRQVPLHRVAEGTVQGSFQHLKAVQMAFSCTRAIMRMRYSKAPTI
jgi:hypothetical protein